MPSNTTCTIIPPNSLTLKHTKSNFSLRSSTPSSSPIKSKSRAGTPVGGRPSSVAGLYIGDSSVEGKTFTFDHCLWSVDDSNGVEFAGQDKLYDVLGEEFLQHSLEGYNCC